MVVDSETHFSLVDYALYQQTKVQALVLVVRDSIANKIKRGGDHLFHFVEVFARQRQCVGVIAYALGREADGCIECSHMATVYSYGDGCVGPLRDAISNPQHVFRSIR
jgi:hypothetical protein